MHRGLWFSVFGAFSKEGKLPLKLIDRGVKINKQLYLNDILKSHVRPHADRMLDDRSYTFQQDSPFIPKISPVSFQCRNGPPAV